MSKPFFSDDYKPVRVIPEESVISGGLTPRQYITYGICGCIIIFMGILLTLIFFNTHSGGVNRHKVDQMIAELNEDNTLQLNTRNMVSFSSLTSAESSDQLIKKNRLSLCYADLLRADTDDGHGSLVANADQLSEERNPFFYMLDVKLTLTFNVDPVLYMRDNQRFDIDRHYMTIAYLISSSYTHFSTIKLVETGLDTRNKALVRTNEVILCSDNPMNQFARSCKVNSQESLFVKNTKLLAMSKLVPWNGSPASTQRKNTTSRDSPTVDTRTTATTTPGNGEDQYDIIHTDGSINSYKTTDDFTRDLRMYNLVFYRLDTPQSEPNARYNTYKDVPVLTIKPSKCK